MIVKRLLISAAAIVAALQTLAQSEIMGPSGTIVSTDKCRYNPGDSVFFTLQQRLEGNVHVRYIHLAEKVGDISLQKTSWAWRPPLKDNTGYLAEIYRLNNGQEEIITTIGIDVSSDWKKFPRYGFVSDYQPINSAVAQKTVDDLNRLHINGLQFYDWHYKHHRPLSGTVQRPDSVWKDIGGREIYASTVRNYIQAAHNRKIKAMFYNLVYGTFKDADRDGVKPEWYLYTDSNHTNRERFDLAEPPFASDLFFTDPSNKGWQEYITKENRKVYDVYDFDGYHMDQVGNRDRTLYNYNGLPVDLSKAFESFINGIKKNEPAKSVVMNAVNQYGQPGIAKTDVDFLYTEVWPPNESFEGLANMILQNDSLSKPRKNSALTAYIHFVEGRNTKGFFNTAAVLLADAVIFAFGGSHLELGDHMVGAPYFPEHNLLMKNDLKDAIVPYYDFLVAYENLLRDGGKFNSAPLRLAASNTGLGAWPAKKGNISFVGKEFDKKQVIHLLNFTDATTLEWRDTLQIQKEPATINNIQLILPADKAVAEVWYASPDVNKGISQKLPFLQKNGELAFKVPFLKYWDMVVITYR